MREGVCAVVVAPVQELDAIKNSRGEIALQTSLYVLCDLALVMDDQPVLNRSRHDGLRNTLDANLILVSGEGRLSATTGPDANLEVAVVLGHLLQAHEFTALLLHELIGMATPPRGIEDDHGGKVLGDRVSVVEQ